MVRSAELSDIDWIIEELIEMDRSYDSKKQIFPGYDRCVELLTETIESHILLVSEPNRSFIAGAFSNHWMNPEITVLSEFLWWVPEQHRNNGIGYALLEEFTEVGYGITDWIVMTSQVKFPIADSSMLNLGYRLQEKHYLMEVN